MLLARKYAHPSKQGLCNYLDFHEEMEAIMYSEGGDERLTDDLLKNETSLQTKKVCINFPLIEFFFLHYC